MIEEQLSGDDANRIERLLSDGIRRLPFPETPESIGQNARRKIAHHRFRRRLAAILAAGSAAAACLLVGIWATNPRTNPEDHAIELQAARLEMNEIEAMFAAPPVDPLAVLEMHQQVAFHALQRMEESR